MPFPLMYQKRSNCSNISEKQQCREIQGRVNLHEGLHRKHSSTFTISSTSLIFHSCFTFPLFSTSLPSIHLNFQIKVYVCIQFLNFARYSTYIWGHNAHLSHPSPAVLQKILKRKFLNLYILSKNLEPIS